MLLVRFRAIISRPRLPFQVRQTVRSDRPHLIEGAEAPIVPPMRIPPALDPYARTLALRYRPRLFCYDAGVRNAPGMVLVHGLGDEADTWRRVLPSLSERYRVVARTCPESAEAPARRARISLRATWSAC